MSHHEIPSAFLIRALARREAEHCDRCGHRMYVKGRSGLCPFCIAERPPRPIAHVVASVPAAAESFAPRLGSSPGWQRVRFGGRLRELLRARRTDRAEPARLALRARHEEPHPSAG